MKKNQKLNVLQEAELVKHVQERLDTVDNNAYQLQWYLNIAYFAGKQWIAYDETNKRLFEPPKEPWQVRFTANRIQPIIRTELAKITKNKFIMTVIPASNDDDDIRSARIGEKVMEWIESELDLQNNVDQEVGLWGLVTSMGFVKPFWNNSKGETVIDPNTGKQFKTGDIDVDIVSPFEIKVDPAAKKWSDVRWVCHEKVRDVDYVKEVYGKEVKPEDGIIESNLYDSQLKNLNLLGRGITYRKADNSVIVKEYWEMPSKNYPRGRRITIANGVLLYHEEDIGFGEDDDTERELPFFPFFHIKVPGRVIPTCVAEQLIPVQREYNKSRSQVIENKNLMANPIWLVEKGALDVGVDITNMPGGMYEYNKGFAKPEMVQPKEISGDVERNIERCIEEFEFISGQHEVSHGQTPPGVKSGVAIAYLQEQDDTKLGPTIANFIYCKQKYMSYMLKMIQKKYDIPRTIRLVGKDKRIEVFDFKGSDLTSTDVRVQEASMYTMSKAAKQDFVIQLIETGVLNPVQDRQLILKMLELGVTDDLYDDYAFDVNHAQEEQDRWKKGDVSPKVRDFFNHEVHIMEHNKFRKTDEYEELPPELQQYIDEHVKQHENFILQAVTPEPEEDSQLDGFVKSLTPEEMEALEQDPELQDEVVREMAGGGGNDMPGM